MASPPIERLQVEPGSPLTPPVLGTIGVRFIAYKFFYPTANNPNTAPNRPLPSQSTIPLTQQIAAQSVQPPSVQTGLQPQPPVSTTIPNPATLQRAPAQHHAHGQHAQQASVSTSQQHPAAPTSSVPSLPAHQSLAQPAQPLLTGMSSTTFGVRPAVGQHPQANLQINQTHANQPTFDQVTASTIQQQARLVNDSFRTLANILQTVHVPTYEIHAFQGLYVWDKFQCTSPLLDYQILGWDQEEKVEAKSSFSFLDHMAGEVYAIKVLRDQEERQYYINEAMLKQIRGLAPALEPGKWSESSTKELDFTEDDAGAVARLVEYLYTRDFDPRLRTAGFTPTIGLFGEQKDKAAMELVDFYCLLDRLCFSKPMSMLLLRIKYLDLSPTAFLQVACKLYDRLLCKTQGREMKTWVNEYINTNAKVLKQHVEVETTMNNGGQLAWDMHRSLLR